MRSSIFIATVITATVILGVPACTNTSGTNTTVSGKMDSAALVKRGEYLVNAIGCDDCHSPKRMGAHGPEIIPELRLSGFPHNGQLPPVDTSEIAKGWTLMAPDLTSAVGQWGASFAGNITSDETGIGNWSEQNFFTALRKGKFKGLEGARDLLPPMPWFVYKNMNDEDIRSIYYYLKTTTPVKNVAPAPRQFAALQ